MIGRHTTYHEVRDAMGAPGCVICRLASRSDRRFLESVAFECVNDPDLRARLRDARGFCNRHAWMLLDDIREPFGTGIIYRDVTRATIRAVKSAAAPRDSTGGCIGCEFRDRAIRRYVSVLVEYAAEPGLANAIATGGGLCLPHARVALGLGGRAVADLMRALSVVAESVGDSPCRSMARNVSVTASSVRGGRSAARPAPDEEAGDPLIALVVGARQSRWSIADERMGTTLCQHCRDGDALVDRALSDPESSLRPGEAPCVHHAWLLYDRVGTARARASFEPIAAALRSALADAGPTLAATAPLMLGRLAFPTRRSREARVEVARSLPLEPTCGFCRLRDGVTAFVPSEPLCRRHLGHRGADPAPSIDWWSAIAADLDEYIRKNDYRFRDEPRGDEQRAPWLAVAAMAASRGRWELA